MYFHRLVVAVGLCLIAAGVRADVTNTRWQLSLIRGSATLETIGAPTQAEAWTKCEKRIEVLSETANPTTVFACQTPRYYATAVSTCQPAPAVQTNTMACPAGTTGSWTQTSTSTVSPAPGCNVTAGPWLPTAAPSGSCVSQPTTGAAKLSWVAPTTNSDSSSLTDLAGYRISYGAKPTELTQVVQVSSPSVTAYVLLDLAPGTYYFAVRAYTTGGRESVASNVISKTIQ